MPNPSLPLVSSHGRMLKMLRKIVSVYDYAFNGPAPFRSGSLVMSQRHGNVFVLTLNGPNFNIQEIREVIEEAEQL